jgi:hypothetical protein
MNIFKKTVTISFAIGAINIMHVINYNFLKIYLHTNSCTGKAANTEISVLFILGKLQFSYSPFRMEILVLLYTNVK